MDRISLDPSSTVLSELSPSTLFGSAHRLARQIPTVQTRTGRSLASSTFLLYASFTDSAQPSSGGKAVALATSTTLPRAALEHQLAVAADGSLTSSCPCIPRGFVTSDLARSSLAPSLGDCNRCPSIVAPNRRIDASQEVADWTRVVRGQQCTVHRQPARVQRILPVRSRARLSRGRFRFWCFRSHPHRLASDQLRSAIGRVHIFESTAHSLALEACSLLPCLQRAMDVSSVPQSSASSASVGDAASQAVAARTSERYKEHPVLVHATPPPPRATASHRLAPNLDGPHSASARQAIHSSTISTPTAVRTSSSSLSVTTPPTSRHSHQGFGCTSALDGSSRSLKFVEIHTSQPLTPPATAASKRRRHWETTNSSLLLGDRSFPPTPFSRSSPKGRIALHRDSPSPESPTLQTQRARKLHRSAASTASLVLQPAFTKRNRAAFTMSSFTATAQLGARQESGEMLSPAQVENTPTTIPPFIKSRALTLDYFDRPTLPPLVGPVRTSRSPSLSWSRYGSEHRSNPYYISDLARRQSYSHTRRAPSTPTPLPVAGRSSSSLQ
ncbi:hypothetical protein L1887_60505 [Cichorium endivia]|nr:hypothetical protein L1887_60505 [Cichorium endivia]